MGYNPVKKESFRRSHSLETARFGSHRCKLKNSTRRDSHAFLSLEPPQEKVEEDRFMREQEKKFFEKKKKELEAKMHEQELAIFQETIAPSMAQAEVLLKKTGDKVSDAGLEALARWKLDMKN